MEDSTLGGYLDKHRRPPAFDGSDGNPYSVEIYVDAEPCEDGNYGAAVLFVRWSAEGGGVAGHLETEYLGYGKTPADASASLRHLTLYEIKDYLDRLIETRKEVPDW
ncbi:MAG: hypothetical protein AMS18_15345 [Gemmatimonas sp. SG8_17]|nr:MAG: hypothetical protein AMS18_15345 [Gemmatimonas sp. SG8_17]